MNMDEAIATYLYLKDNTHAWVEPGKTILEEARQMISSHAKGVIARRAHEQSTREG